MKNTQENIAVFGGAFNPPTFAHKQVITEILDSTSSGIDKIILTPDGDRWDKDYGTTIKDRKKMLKLFYEGLKKEGYNIELETYFLEGKNNSGTTLLKVRAYFKEKLGDYPWHIFGTDVIPNLDKWSGNQNSFIEKIVKKIFIKRPGYDCDMDMLANYKIVDVDNMSALSSSIIRNKIKSKQKISGLILPEISKYIEKKGLYT